MTRMIERWFPCQEVSENSATGWGSGRTEKALFTWFAARPSAQARAAVLCSLLPWPDEPLRQAELQALVRLAMTDRDAGQEDVIAMLEQYFPAGARVLDPFSGRGMIPLEAARLGLAAFGIDYSPVATLAGLLLADFPFRDWSHEPDLLEGEVAPGGKGDRVIDPRPRLVRDIDRVLRAIGSRARDRHAGLLPTSSGKAALGISVGGLPSVSGVWKQIPTRCLIDASV